YSEEDFAQFRAAVDIPLLANMTEFGKTELMSAQKIQDLGYNAVIWPVSTFRVAMGATEEFLRDMKDDGLQSKEWLERMQHRSRRYELVRYHGHNDFDQSLFPYSQEPYQPPFQGERSCLQPRKSVKASTALLLLKPRSPRLCQRPTP